MAKNEPIFGLRDQVTVNNPGTFGNGQLGQIRQVCVSPFGDGENTYLVLLFKTQTETYFLERNLTLQAKAPPQKTPAA
jgi:hypothetical protein